MFCLSVNNNNFMWLTRGKNWEFRFLSEPPGFDSRKKLYKSVFLQDEGYIGYWKGCFSKNNKILYYTACRCFDEEKNCRDAAGRRIPHEFLILCAQAEQEQLALLQWGQFVIGKTRDFYMRQYALDAFMVEKCVIDFAFTEDDLSMMEHCSDILEVNPNNSQKTRRNQERKRQKNMLFLLVLFFLLAFVLGLTTFFLWDNNRKQKICCVEKAAPITRNNVESHDFMPHEKEPLEHEDTLYDKGEVSSAEE